jgi:hypothetical protein
MLSRPISKARVPEQMVEIKSRPLVLCAFPLCRRQKSKYRLDNQFDDLIEKAITALNSLAVRLFHPITQERFKISEAIFPPL